MQKRHWWWWLMLCCVCGCEVQAKYETQMLDAQDRAELLQLEREQRELQKMRNELHEKISNGN